MSCCNGKDESSCILMICYNHSPLCITRPEQPFPFDVKPPHPSVSDTNVEKLDPLQRPFALQRWIRAIQTRNRV